MESPETAWTPHAAVSLVMGSTGVGGSTAAAALSVAAALHGLDVVLIATDPAPVLEVLLGGKELDDSEHLVFSNHGRLRVSRVPANQVFSDHLDQGGLGGMFRRALSGSSLPLIAGAVPGLHDLLILTGVLDRERRRDADAIIVDCPGSGRAFEFLHSVEDAAEVVQSPRLLESAVDIQMALGDPERFEAIPVMVPESDDGASTRALVDRVRTLKALSVRDLVATRVLPDEAPLRAAQAEVVDATVEASGIGALWLPRLDGGVSTQGDVHELAEQLAVWP